MAYHLTIQKHLPISTKCTSVKRKKEQVLSLISFNVFGFQHIHKSLSNLHFGWCISPTSHILVSKHAFILGFYASYRRVQKKKNQWKFNLKLKWSRWRKAGMVIRQFHFSTFCCGGIKSSWQAQIINLNKLLLSSTNN